MTLQLEMLWHVWSRPDKATYSINHLLEKSEGGIDTTVCGWEYRTTGRHPQAHAMFNCKHCEGGVKSEFHFRLTADFVAEAR